MYFEDCFSDNNINALVLGALCHAIDEYFDNNCNEIFININDNSLEIVYNAGMSLNKSFDLTKAECIMTKVGACSNQKKHLEVGKEFCHIGMTAINAVSKNCELNTISNKQKGHFIFEKGITIFKEIFEINILKDSTTIKFEIDKEIFGNFTFQYDDLLLKLNLLKEKLPNLRLILNKL